jgi:hypothetical protein
MDIKEYTTVLYKTLKDQAELKANFYNRMAQDIFKNRRYLECQDELILFYQNERDLAHEEINFFQNKIDELK